MQVWDAAIITAEEKVDNGFSNQTIDPYFSKLLSRIKRDDFYIPSQAGRMHRPQLPAPSPGPATRMR
ncbi:hypothetical protein BDBG_16183 [Blastomyces gilchristii SLH14081]|uniref:Uncharacterized protein n=1 Tax=Blastomyces gilchristii (strain SLH14081) TaxID=559298 RepID=A0A179UAR8_BLAGS|nr:uncharacterized protein BDBG_16183 [Blastomyces gilchristii SLH14081]OAT04101.1 hypothetical protein BDBG_16183 [Blastomyces gilchristii SLH14081]